MNKLNWTDFHYPIEPGTPMKVVQPTRFGDIGETVVFVNYYDDDRTMEHREKTMVTVECPIYGQKTLFLRRFAPMGGNPW